MRGTPESERVNTTHQDSHKLSDANSSTKSSGSIYSLASDASRKIDRTTFKECRSEGKFASSEPESTDSPERVADRLELREDVSVVEAKEISEAANCTALAQAGERNN